MGQAKAQISKELSIKISKGVLSGTLLQADTIQATPVVLIIPGSGPTDRNGNSTFTKNNALKMLADSLAKHHISSLRIDKRMIGKSKLRDFTEKDIRFDDFVADATLWIQKLQADKSFSKIIVAGHSQGALVGLLAAQKAKVDAYISLAGAGSPIDKILKKQFSEAIPVIKNPAYRLIDSLKAGHKVAIVPGLLQMVFRPSAQDFLISWMQYDPAEILKQYHKPILLIQGDADLQVSLEDVKRLKTFQPDAKMIIIQRMNHVLKPVPENNKAYNLATYNNPDIPLHPKLISNIVHFVNKLDDK